MSTQKRASLEKVEDLFALAGGPGRLAVAVDRHQWTVERWRKSGVPYECWVDIIRTYDVTPDELFVITEHAKQQRSAS
jgi:hypothetical protein